MSFEWKPTLSRIRRHTAGHALLFGLVALLAAPKADATPALVVDVDTQSVLFAEEAGVPWYPASTTKLMTALVVFEALRSGEMTMETPVVMSRKAMGQISLHAGLSVGRTMTLEDAIFATLAGSANEVAVAMAETVAGSDTAFVARMNAEAARLGLTATHFVNPNGTFDRAQRTSARDLALLGMMIDRNYPEHRRFFQATGVTVDGQVVDSFNDLLSRFPGTVGMKTGFLCASGRNLVGLTERDGRRLMVVLLGATTDRERGERAAQLLTQAFSGALSGSKGPVEALPNQPEIQPEDMRMRLCTDQAAQYEAGREALYPMGLPGQESYLGPSMPANRHAIRTWMTEPAADVPTPLPRPAAL